VRQDKAGAAYTRAKRARPMQTDRILAEDEGSPHSISTVQKTTNKGYSCSAGLVREIKVNLRT